MENFDFWSILVDSGTIVHCGKFDRCGGGVDLSLTIFIAHRSAILPMLVTIWDTLKMIVEPIFNVSHPIIDYRSDGAALVRSM